MLSLVCLETNFLRGGETNTIKQFYEMSELQGPEH